MTVVIGIGNAMRGDDAAGLRAARLVREAAPHLTVIESDGEPSALMAGWAGVAHVYVIDACTPMGGPGAIHRFETHESPLPERLGAVSSHGFGLATTIELARALKRLPARLVVFAIEGARFEPGAPVSSEVEAAAAEVASKICKETPLRRQPGLLEEA